MAIQPRLKTSRKKTDFPLDYTKMIREVINKNFKKFVKNKDVVIEGLIFEEEILMRVGFLDSKNTIRQVNFEASADYSIKSKNIMDQIYLALDAVGAMIDQYIKAEGDIELPTVWTKFDMDGKAVFLQTSSENSDLEATANALLGETEEEDGD